MKINAARASFPDSAQPPKLTGRRPAKSDRRHAVPHLDIYRSFGSELRASNPAYSRKRKKKSRRAFRVETSRCARARFFPILRIVTLVLSPADIFNPSHHYPPPPPSLLFPAGAAKGLESWFCEIIAVIARARARVSNRSSVPLPGRRCRNRCCYIRRPLRALFQNGDG